MGKTYRNYKGTTYKPASSEQRKSTGKDKFMGHTSGSHTGSDNPQPVKGIDYLKYGYPHDFRTKRDKQAHQLRVERKNIGRLIRNAIY